MRRFRRAGVWFLLIVALLIAHTLLLRLAHDRNAAAAVLSGGPHTPVGLLALAGGLIVVRLALFLILPGCLAWVGTRALLKRSAPGYAQAPPTTSDAS